MADQRGGGAARVITVTSSPWMLLIGVVPSVLFLLAWLFLPSQPSSRVSGFIILLLIINVPPAIGMIRCRITISGGVLAVRGIIGSQRVFLPQLRMVSAGRAGSARSRHWQLTFADVDGHRAELSFTGYRSRDRRLVLAALAPYVQAAGVEHAGPVESALAGTLWSSPPRQRTPGYQGGHERQ